MQKAISEIRRLLEGKSVNTLMSDAATRAAFERFLEILSEASRHIPEDLKNEFSDIPWRQVADIGNFIRHVYHKIDIKSCSRFTRMIWTLLKGLFNNSSSGCGPLNFIQRVA